jgi:hypothetical protein
MLISCGRLTARGRRDEMNECQHRYVGAGLAAFLDNTDCLTNEHERHVEPAQTCPVSTLLHSPLNSNLVAKHCHQCSSELMSDEKWTQAKSPSTFTTFCTEISCQCLCIWAIYRTQRMCIMAQGLRALNHGSEQRYLPANMQISSGARDVHGGGSRELQR